MLESPRLLMYAAGSENTRTAVFLIGDDRPWPYARALTRPIGAAQRMILLPIRHFRTMMDELY